MTITNGTRIATKVIVMGDISSRPSSGSILPTRDKILLNPSPRIFPSEDPADDKLDQVFDSWTLFIRGPISDAIFPGMSVDGILVGRVLSDIRVGTVSS
jgi:hypothetical protein